MIQMYGARNRDRTCDLELRRLLLYPTELSGHTLELFDIEAHALYRFFEKRKSNCEKLLNEEFLFEMRIPTRLEQAF